MDIGSLLTIGLGLYLLWLVVERLRRVTHAMAGGLHDNISLPHEQAWELYHNDFSLCSKKTRVCLAELGIAAFEHPTATRGLDAIKRLKAEDPAFAAIWSG